MQETEILTGKFVSIDEDRGRRIECYLLEGEFHREDGWAYRHWDLETGVLRQERSYRNGELHSVGDLPAYIDWVDGVVVHARSWYRFGKLHRDPRVGPAYEEFYHDGTLREALYQLDGKSHRPVAEGPAVLHFAPDGSVKFAEYWFMGKKLPGPVAIRPSVLRTEAGGFAKAANDQ